MSSVVNDEFAKIMQDGGRGGDLLMGGFENIHHAEEAEDEDRFVLIDESDEEAEDEDFVLTNNVVIVAKEEEEVELAEKVKKEGSHPGNTTMTTKGEADDAEFDVIAAAGTKQLVFFISILVVSYVLAINVMAGFCLLAQSFWLVDASQAERRGAEPPVVVRLDENKNKWNIPTLVSSSSTNKSTRMLQQRQEQQSHSLMMIPHPSRHISTTTSTAIVLEEPEHHYYMMPSPAVADKSPTANRSSHASPPDIDASSYHRRPVEEDESSSSAFKQVASLQDQIYFPSLDAAWPRPTPSPKRTNAAHYPSLSTLSVVQDSGLMISVVAGDILQIPVPPKTRPLHFPAIGGQIPYSPTLHIPSLAMDRVRTFWNNWAAVRDDKVGDDASIGVENKNVTATVSVQPPAVFPVVQSTTFEAPAVVKSDLDTFLEQHGDRSVVFFYSSRHKSSSSSPPPPPPPDVHEIWRQLAEKVRHTMQVDCHVDRDVCRSHRIAYVPAMMMVQNGRIGQELAFEADPFKMFTKYIVAVNAINNGPSIPSLRQGRRRTETAAAVIALSQYSFRDFLNQHKHAVVVFDHVTRGDVDRQVWKHFAEALDREGLNVVLATIDCHSNPKICRNQSIRTIPTIRWFTDGLASAPDFQKQLVKKKFVKYARRVLAGVEA